MNRATPALAMILCTAGCARSVQVLELQERGFLGEGGLDDAGMPTRDARPEEDAAQATGSAGYLAAFEHTCVVDESGVFCWGRNSDRQLGLGGESTAAGARPRRVQAAGEYTALCAGERHSCGLREDGVLECWGGNGQGQLGLGNLEPRAAPTPLEGLPELQKVACGGNITCAIAQDGALYCWGDNAEGELGQGEGGPAGRDSSSPLRVPFEQPFQQVSIGQGHVCAIAEDGALYCWGRNNSLQLGIGSLLGQVRTPTPVMGGGTYRHVAAAQHHTCAVHTDGRLFCWGFDLDGRLGLGVTQGDVPAPTQVGAASDYREVQTNWFHSCALRAQGRLVCWGRNAEGQLGLGDWTWRGQPEDVSAGSAPWSAVAVGRFHTCGVRAGAVYCWGKNDADQQLGLDDLERRNLPTWVALP
jgi:alpha-tubulin suppressor-like RCC1 family protein